MEIKDSLRCSLRKSLVPNHIHEAIVSYAIDHVPPGGFLKAVFKNDLYGSLAHADQANRAAIMDIVGFIYAELPDDCWGDEHAYFKWITQRGNDR